MSDARNQRDQQETRSTSLLAVAGVVAPLLFTVLVVVAGLLRPSYDHVRDYISDLGAGSNAWVMNSNFLLTGLLMVAFSAGLLRGLHAGKSVKVGSTLVGISGAGAFSAGIFSCDPGCPSSGGSPSQQMHGLVSLISFLAIIIAPIIISLGMNSHSLWRGYRLYSFATGVVAIGFLIIFFASTEYVGALERLVIAPLFLWIGVTALRLFNLYRLSPSAVPPSPGGP